MKKALISSGAIHLLALLIVGIIVLLSSKESPQRRVKVEIKEVIRPSSSSEKATPTVNLNEKVKPDYQEITPRKVFGLNKNAIKGGEAASVEIKAGNTIAKDVDQDRLNPDDAEALPIPTEEYLISKMPRIKAEVRVPYPAEARQKNIEGAVVMDVLIDELGRVRKATLIEGPGFGLNEAALNAIYRFEFEPAYVDNKAVAVRIRYSYRFLLN
jgi:protein TonB